MKLTCCRHSHEKGRSPNQPRQQVESDAELNDAGPDIVQIRDAHDEALDVGVHQSRRRGLLRLGKAQSRGLVEDS